MIDDLIVFWGACGGSGGGVGGDKGGPYLFLARRKDMHWNSCEFTLDSYLPLSTTWWADNDGGGNVFQWC